MTEPTPEQKARYAIGQAVYRAANREKLRLKAKARYAKIAADNKAKGLTSRGTKPDEGAPRRARYATPEEAAKAKFEKAKIYRARYNAKNKEQMRSKARDKALAKKEQKLIQQAIARAKEPAVIEKACDKYDHQGKMIVNKNTRVVSQSYEDVKTFTWGQTRNKHF